MPCNSPKVAPRIASRSRLAACRFSQQSRKAVNKVYKVYRLTNGLRQQTTTLVIIGCVVVITVIGTSCNQSDERVVISGLPADTISAIETPDTSSQAPSLSDRLSAVRGQINRFKGDNQLDPSLIEGGAIEWLRAQLTPSESPQGFAIAPVEVGGSPTKYAVAMRSQNGKWLIGDAPEIYGVQFKVVDVDNDGVDELYTVSKGEGQGVIESTHSLLNLEGKKPKTLFQAYGFDRTDMLPLLEAGDTLLTTLDLKFAEEDSQGNKKLEVIQSGEVLSKQLKPLAIKPTRKVYSLQNGRYSL